ncbi:MAG: hypothetical protein QOE70_4087 [Chthoniobacter sp.]|jgi:hypothetical protein|nr:hypothetical protein [Chthoniobacter sp.]
MPPTPNNSHRGLATHRHDTLSALPRLAALTFIAVLALSGLGARAEDSTGTPLSYEYKAGASYVTDAKFKRRGASVGSISELDSHGNLVASIPIRDTFLLRLGVDWQRYSYSVPDRAPLPDTLQSLSLVIGADFQLGQSWLVRFEAQPGWYGNGDTLRSRDAEIPLVLGASYIVSADLQLVAGVSYNPNRKYPVLPGIGLRWKFSENWVLNAILPAPRLEYTPNQALTLYAGADLRADTYRVSADFGRSIGHDALNDAVVDHWELRFGAGAGWKVARYATIEVEVGCVPIHQFDYHRAEIGVRTVETAPYLSIGFKGSF